SASHSRGSARPWGIRRAERCWWRPQTSPSTSRPCREAPRSCRSRRTRPRAPSASRRRGFSRRTPGGFVAWTRWHRRPAPRGNGARRARPKPIVPASLTVRGARTRAFAAPLNIALGTSVAVIRTVPLLLVDLATEEGIAGRAYLFAYTPAGAKSIALLLGEA